VPVRDSEEDLAGGDLDLLGAAGPDVQQDGQQEVSEVPADGPSEVEEEQVEA
jgi:hypothetical protein